MLPSRLFRNVGISHPLRTLSPSLSGSPTSTPALLRLRCSHTRSNSSLRSPSSEQNLSSPSSSVQSSQQASSSSPNGSGVSTTNKIQLEQPEPRLALAFTCTVTGCGTRSTHQFSKRSYERGIVLVECPGCKNRHLIADHLGWFKEGTQEGKLKTIEDIMKQKGETVKRGRLDAGGVVEYAPDS